MPKYEESYVGRIRKLIGQKKLIVVVSSIEDRQVDMLVH